MSSLQRQGAWTWTEHLLGGGSTPWAAWVAAGPHDGTPPDGWHAPGAAQLELLRRVNVRAGRVPRVADLLLSRSGPGRGLGQQPLRWPADGPAEPTPSYGAPAVDPVEVPASELVRLGVGVLTELLLATPAEELPVPEEKPRRRWTRGPAHEVTGAPISAAVVRARTGVPEGGRHPEVLIVGAPFDDLLAQVWSARVQRGAPVRWAGFVERWSGRDALPPSADLPALAAHWAERVGREHVHVVAPGAGIDPTGVAHDLLGTAGRSPLAPRWTELPTASVDLLRRVNAVLAVRVPEEQHGRLARGLARLLRGPSEPLTVPEPFAAWARDRAARLAADLAARGYPVHGDLADLAPRLQGPRRPDVEQVLDQVVASCLRLAGRREDAA